MTIAGAGQWRANAACGPDDLPLFFETADESQARRKARAREAKRICGRCPVRQECLEASLEVGDRYGIFGGKTAEERGRMRRRRRLEAPKAPPVKTPRKPPRRRVDATGTRRRLQALALIGYSPAQLAPRLKASPTHLTSVRKGVRDRVLADLAARLAELYPRLVDRPNVVEGRMTVSCAEGRGWYPPDAWVGVGVDIDDPASEPITSAETAAA